MLNRFLHRFFEAFGDADVITEAKLPRRQRAAPRTFPNFTVAVQLGLMPTRLPAKPP